jgi:hypothetical protein
LCKTALLNLKHKITKYILNKPLSCDVNSLNGYINKHIKNSKKNSVFRNIKDIKIGQDTTPEIITSNMLGLLVDDIIEKKTMPYPNSLVIMHNISKLLKIFKPDNIDVNRITRSLIFIKLKIKIKELCSKISKDPKCDYSIEKLKKAVETYYNLYHAKKIEKKDNTYLKFKAVSKDFDNKNFLFFFNKNRFINNFKQILKINTTTPTILSGLPIVLLTLAAITVKFEKSNSSKIAILNLVKDGLSSIIKLYDGDLSYYINETVYDNIITESKKKND